MKNKIRWVLADIFTLSTRHKTMPATTISFSVSVEGRHGGGESGHE